MTPLGLGNDLGGSLRVPSQMCGTAAIRPSRGRVANWLADAGYEVVDAEPPQIAEAAAASFDAIWADGRRDLCPARSLRPGDQTHLPMDRLAAQ
jgi:Asp-tRNA(Asn)/Glu-tRNA(Gln) amidotransferase A subunit family amidase